MRAFSGGFAKSYDFEREGCVFLEEQGLVWLGWLGWLAGWLASSVAEWLAGWLAVCLAG